MNRPLLIRLAPDRWKIAVYDRFFHARKNDGRHDALFANATIRLASHTRMIGLLPGDHISGCIAFTGLYEYDLSKRVCELAQAGGLFVDVGANMGYFTLLWLAARPNNRVVAVEASPRNVARLKQNMLTNGVAERCEILAVAAGKEPGVLNFDLGPEDQTGWGGLTLDRSAVNSGSSASIDVKVERLDCLLRDREHIALLKIDIEGADTWALEGLSGLLRERRIGTIYFEQNMERARLLGIAPDEATCLLERYGYRIELLSGDPSETAEYVATLR